MEECALKTIRILECWFNIDITFMLPQKSDIKSLCLAHVDKLIAEYEGVIAELQKGMFEETKSSAGDKYEQVIKVYSINIVYFELGQGDDYIYKGESSFKGLHTHSDLELSKKQKQLYKF